MIKKACRERNVSPQAKTQWRKPEGQNQSENGQCFHTRVKTTCDGTTLTNPCPKKKKEQGSTTRKPNHLKRKNAAFTPVPFSFHMIDKIPWARTLLKIKLSTAVWEARSFRHETTWFVPRFLQTYSMLILQCDLYLIYVSQFASSERTRENAENGTGRYEIKYNDLQISLCSTCGYVSKWTTTKSMEQVHFSNEVSWILMTKLWICRVYGDKSTSKNTKILTGSQKHYPYRPAWTMWSDAENHCGTTGPKNYSGKEDEGKRKKTWHNRGWCALSWLATVWPPAAQHNLVPLPLPRFLDPQFVFCLLLFLFYVLWLRKALAPQKNRPQPRTEYRAYFHSSKIKLWVVAGGCAIFSFKWHVFKLWNPWQKHCQFCFCCDVTTEILWWPLNDNNSPLAAQNSRQDSPLQKNWINEMWWTTGAGCTNEGERGTIFCNSAEFQITTTNTKQQKPNTRPQRESHHWLQKTMKPQKTGKEQVKQAASPQSLLNTPPHRCSPPSKTIRFMILWPGKSVENENPRNKLNAKMRIHCYLATETANTAA